MKSFCCWILIVGLTLSASALPVWAKASAGRSAPPAPKTGDMVDVSAQESLEWHKNERLYVARGQARAIVHGTTIEADLLTAHQRDKTAAKADKASKSDAMGSGDIDRLTAEGSVRIFDDKQQAEGDKAEYDVDAHLFKMTGSKLRYATTKGDVVTAKDSFDYDETQKIAIARGQAVAEHEGNRLEGDILTAHFAESAAGQMDMDRMTAKGHVVIVTKDGAIARGNHADYDVKRDVAVLTDQVRITRGDTQLAGGKAEVDFKSGQSKLLGEKGGRVRVLLPSSGADKKEKP